MPNVAKVAMRWVRSASAEFVCTFHVKKADSEPELTNDELEAIGQAAVLWWESDPPSIIVPPLRDGYDERTILEDVKVHTVEPTIGDPVFVVPTLGAGAQGEDSRVYYPPQVAIGIGLRTSLDSRRGRGRIYLPMTVHTLTGDIFSPLGAVAEDRRGLHARYGASLAEWIRAIIADPLLVLAVYSRVDGEARAVTHFAIPDRLLTQRRRMVEPEYQPFGLTGDPA